MMPQDDSNGQVPQRPPLRTVDVSLYEKDGFLDSLKSSLQTEMFEKIDKLTNIGIKLMEKGYDDLAIKCFDPALKVYSKDVSLCINNKGVCLLRMGRYHEAIKYFDRAIQMNPNYELAHMNKSIAMLYQLYHI
jgi:tetratricopeptide (TPR) repeat protein